MKHRFFYPQISPIFADWLISGFNLRSSADALSVFNLPGRHSLGGGGCFICG
jgi:hypothetical protein